MNLQMRPSKCFLYEVMAQRLAGIREGVAIDAASGPCKNRPLFKTALYVGVDLNEARLRQGLRTYPGDDTVAVLADLTNVETFPTGVAAVVVSSNTLHRIDPARRMAAIESLVRMTAPIGVLMCTIPLDGASPPILAALEGSFRRVERVYYRNLFSRFYEWLFARPGKPDTDSIVGTKLFRVVAWTVSRLEYLTHRHRWGCSSVLIICRDKRSRDREAFSLTHFPMLDDRLYDARPSA